MIKEDIITTDVYGVGDSVMFTGDENLLHFDHHTGNLVNVYFNLGKGSDTRFCGIIVDIKGNNDHSNGRCNEASI